MKVTDWFCRDCLHVYILFELPTHERICPRCEIDLEPWEDEYFEAEVDAELDRRQRRYTGEEEECHA